MVKVTKEEKKLIDSLHAFNSKGNYYFGCNHDKLVLYFSYGIYELEIYYEDSGLSFGNVGGYAIYEYEDFIEEDI